MSDSRQYSDEIGTRNDPHDSLLDSYGVNNSDDGKASKGGCGCPWTRARILCVAYLVVLLLYGIVMAVVFHKQIGHGFSELSKFLGPDGKLKEWLSAPGTQLWAPFAYGAIYVICTVALLPASALTILAGVIFPLWEALVVVSAASTIGATCAMLLGRTVLRNWVLRKVAAFKSFLAVERAISKTSWLVFLLRLSPVIPFNILNYALGLTAVPTLHYIVFSWFGMMPGTFLFVYIGYATGGAIGNADKGSKLAETILKYVVGPIVTILVVVIVTIVARKQLKIQMDLADAEVDEEAPGDEAAPAPYAVAEAKPKYEAF
eukprot:TRINITY_DN3036_c0_g1_i1.p1 TRINITY_DN3036_c0_g1~~TRINITY_DN3036_c0_g1_i1.p1  ORF type:complete len:318 (-),score=95.65 TRINITY_DN3036_c0_g1_i1:122-1075(-)